MPTSSLLQSTRQFQLSTSSGKTTSVPNLSFGSSGALVTSLQQTLNTLNIVDPKLVEDGKFGKRTDEAVRFFQEKAKLTVDGVVGPNTRNALSTALANPLQWTSPRKSEVPPEVVVDVHQDSPPPGTTPGTTPVMQAQAGFPVVPALAVLGVVAFLWMRKK